MATRPENSAPYGRSDVSPGEACCSGVDAVGAGVASGVSGVAAGGCADFDAARVDLAAVAAVERLRDVPPPAALAPAARRGRAVADFGAVLAPPACPPRVRAGRPAPRAAPVRGADVAAGARGGAGRGRAASAARSWRTSSTRSSHVSTSSWPSVTTRSRVVSTALMSAFAAPVHSPVIVQTPRSILRRSPTVCGTTRPAP